MKIEEMISAARADCSGCSACANICPKNAIEMIRDAEGFSYPKINPELCIKCGRCDSTCPALNFRKKIVEKLPATFAAIHPDEKILRHSSSGGIFSALSEIILQNGGVVFGAAFDKNWRVVHTSAETLNELENLRGSKYAQSQIGLVYRQAKKSLEAGRKVLFSGTPCQCAGLKHFLGKDYENLLKIEILCHGVPSPGLWENYIGEIGYAHPITHINFRSKRNGWASNMDINFADQGHILTANSKNLYGKLFLRGITERPSCSVCKCKFPNGEADLSIGDAWGIKDFAPEMYNELGTSIIFVHTEKGNNFFRQMNLIKKQIKFRNVAKSSFMIPLAADSRREKFFAEIAKSATPIAVMQKYFLEDTTEIRKEASRKSSRIYNEIYNAVAAHIRQKFEKNILIVAAPHEDFEKQFPNCGLYFLYINDKGQLICKENFSSLTFEQKDSAALTDLVKKFNVAEIFVEEPPKIESPVVTDWLKNCGLLVQTLKSK